MCNGTMTALHSIADRTRTSSTKFGPPEFTEYDGAQLFATFLRWMERRGSFYCTFPKDFSDQEKAGEKDAPEQADSTLDSHAH
ncbi:hypothetical protein AXG93_1712s1500 [Marchantia polymorpha subsp. ruderalis]|uniref:Uncharacterized protein n=1 Tax=Marchantia polymorpha subsp. ruderalis TaxID=1480154 RepID=A0A176VYW5_MARPO|nr:hypothetical protein AXG93_1712s1500 [Marchantia polymorpha subsp. ruderalis]